MGAKSSPHELRVALHRHRSEASLSNGWIYESVHSISLSVWVPAQPLDALGGSSREVRGGAARQRGSEGLRYGTVGVFRLQGVGVKGLAYR